MTKQKSRQEASRRRGNTKYDQYGVGSSQRRENKQDELRISKTNCKAGNEGDKKNIGQNKWQSKKKSNIFITYFVND